MLLSNRLAEEVFIIIGFRLTNSNAILGWEYAVGHSILPAPSCNGNCGLEKKINGEAQIISFLGKG